jgi:hypothetical protein
MASVRPLVLHPTRAEVANFFRCDKQSIARNPILVEAPSLGREVHYTEASVEALAETLDVAVVWIDRTSGKIFDPAVGLVTA